MDSSWSTIVTLFALFAIGWCLQCPRCQNAGNIKACQKTSETCNQYQDVCIGTLSEWKFSMGCGTSRRCQYDTLQSNTDCRGDPFKLHDRCTVCCTGDYCNDRLAHVQRGLDLIPNVLHCPVCPYRTTDPQECMNNIQPCPPDAVTCEVTKAGGYYLSTCSTNKTCTADHNKHPGRTDCVHDSDLCSVCCTDLACLDTILGIPPKEPFIKPGVEVTPATMGPEIRPTLSHTPSLLTLPPEPDCTDDNLFRCTLTMCADHDLATSFCKRTCGHCPTTGVVPPSPQPTVSAQCPSCLSAQNTQECLKTLAKCPHPDDVCMVGVEKWKVTAHCVTSKMCTEFERDYSNRNCTAEKPFSPFDKCYTCCRGDQCTGTLAQIQTGLDQVPVSLHCPDCSHQVDPQDCFMTSVTCTSHHDTCEVRKQHGKYSSKCASSNHCDENQSKHSDNCTSESCTVCCHDHDCVTGILGSETPTLTATKATICKDKELFPCHQTALDGACADSEFAKEFCPETCGYCPTIPPEKCHDSPLFPCTFTTSTTCADLDLATSFCPVHCGLCTPSPGMQTTDGTFLTTTPIPPDQLHPTLECPYCRRDHIDDCLTRTQKCHVDQDVCMGSLLEWDFHMGCSFSQVCNFKTRIPGTTNCTRGTPYGPHEECYICCTGDECLQDLQMVKQSIESIPGVIHCPSCDDVDNPEDCLKNIVSCRPLDTTCRISKSNGKFSSECTSSGRGCHDELSMPPEECLDSEIDCITCCSDTDCLNKALRFPTVTTGGCKDDPTFPCTTSSTNICADPDFASNTCPETCGVCDGSTVKPVTHTSKAPVQIPPEKCKDANQFPCSLSKATTCLDNDLAATFCPVTCNLCTPTNAAVTTATPVTTLPPAQVHPTLECPHCRRDHIDDCLTQTQKCHVDQDVCMGSLLDWDFHMGCSFSQFCNFKSSLPGATNCTRGTPYLPHEECYVCCTGDQCLQDLQAVKQSIESIPNVLHCPSCHDVKDPADCLNNMVSCRPIDETCRISKRNGTFTSYCTSRTYRCHDELSMPPEDCLDSEIDCHTCCADSDCLNKALSAIQIPPEKCKDSNQFPCSLSKATTCLDNDLAATFCPVTCNLCTPTNVAVTTATPATTALPPAQVHPTLECPHCRRDHIDDCLTRTQKCHVDQDVCMGSLLDWDFHMGCSFSQFCNFKSSMPGATNCTRGTPYLPHEECYVCCTGDQCLQDLQAVKQSIESIPNVLHCPSCHDVKDPADCLNNIVSCRPLDQTCGISKRNGNFSSYCTSRTYRCHDELSMSPEDCLDSEIDCHTCCADSDCFNKALSVTGPLVCKDDVTFPCATAASSICGDPDFAINTCPVTCGHCGGSNVITGTTTTLPPLTPPTDCKDDPTFPCSTSGPAVCKDQDFAILTCPYTCGHC